MIIRARNLSKTYVVGVENGPTPTVARLKNGVSMEQTSARLAALLENLTEDM